MDCDDDAVPDIPFSRALSQEVEKTLAELGDIEQHEEDEFDSLHVQAQRSEFCTVVDLSNCSAGKGGHNPLEEFEVPHETMTEHQAELAAELKKKNRMKKLSARTTHVAGRTHVSGIDQGFVTAAVRDILKDASLSEHISGLSGKSEPSGRQEACPADSVEPEPAHSRMEDVKASGAEAISTPNCETAGVQYAADTTDLFGDPDEVPDFSHDRDQGTGDTPTGGNLACLTKPPSRIVKTVQQGLEFQKDALEFLVTDGSCDDPDSFVNHLQEALQQDSLSTCYSGIESAHTATNCNAYAFSKATGNPMVCVPILHMVEWDTESQKELLMVAESHPQCCLFGDIATFYRDELADTIRQLKDHMCIIVFGMCLIVSKYTSCQRIFTACFSHLPARPAS